MKKVKEKQQPEHQRVNFDESMGCTGKPKGKELEQVDTYNGNPNCNECNSEDICNYNNSTNRDDGDNCSDLCTDEECYSNHNNYYNYNNGKEYCNACNN
eukprot:CAMPEP_0174256272 /NCGR_PEP_ID=MMETSP0439-20130205/5525_1 /TAXON_ID=0 /ORGANISM="Stereomyxa ramosa, Strain Chinc5" /LENGTH=98 /DNA_ID=CAMNT_0015338801 /DNA_START=142 /DNA_END=435 /DNA_ORIENTATION=+